METNDTNVEGTSNSSTNIYGDSGSTDLVQGQDDNRAVLTYRMTASEFEGFTNAWNNEDYHETVETTYSQDGRVYHNYMAGLSGAFVDTTDSTKIAYLDYPECTLSNGDEWYCQFYLPSNSAQTDRYPSFNQPGELVTYFFSSYIPDNKSLSFGSASSLTHHPDGAENIATFAASIGLMLLSSLIF